MAAALLRLWDAPQMLPSPAKATKIYSSVGSLTQRCFSPSQHTQLAETAMHANQATKEIVKPCVPLSCVRTQCPTAYETLMLAVCFALKPGCIILVCGLRTLL
jgi:hypothetical protein